MSVRLLRYRRYRSGAEFSIFEEQFLFAIFSCQNTKIIEERNSVADPDSLIPVIWIHAFQWIQIRIPDPDPSYRWPKIQEFTVKKIENFLNIKNFNIFNLRSATEAVRSKKSLQPSKDNIQHFEMTNAANSADHWLVSVLNLELFM